MKRELPARPPCFGQYGRLHCPCSDKPDRIACASARMFWCTAETIARLKDNAGRTDTLALIARTRGHTAAQDLRSAAWELMQEAKQGDLLACA